MGNELQPYASNRQGLAGTILLLAVVGVTVLVYWPGLQGPLLLDDIPQLNSLIAQSGEASTFLLDNYLISTSGPLGRPVSMASFIADAVFHGPDIWWWKFDSLVLHLISGLLLACLMKELVTASDRNARTQPWIAGVLVGGIWLLHPLNVSTVLYTVQRMTVLSTLFIFAGLLCYVKGRLLQATRPALGWFLIAAAFVVCMPLAVLSKESGALFPLYCTLVEFVVLLFRGPAPIRRTLKIGHGILLASYVVGIGLLAASSGFVTDAYAAREFTLAERVLTEFRVLAVYITQIILPLPGRMGFFHDDFPISRSLVDPVTTLLSMVFIIGLIVVAWAGRKRQALVAFGILFFFASHSLESTVFGLEIMFEHRNYTGSPGIFLALVAGAAQFARRDWVLPATATSCLLLFALLTWQRAGYWSSPVSMYQHMYAVHPQSSRLNMILSNVYATAGDFDNARLMLNRVKPGAGRYVHKLYLDCVEYQHVNPESLTQLGFEGGEAIDAHVTSSVDLLVDAAIGGRCNIPSDALVNALDQILGLKDRSFRDRRSILFAKARLLDAMRKPDAAVATYLAAQALSDVYAVPLYRAADTLARYGRPGEARVLLKQAALVERNSEIVRKDLAELIYTGISELYIATGKPLEAMATYDEALDAMPESLGIQVARAELQLAQGQVEEASRSLAAIVAQHAADQGEYGLRIALVKATLDKKVAATPK